MGGRLISSQIYLQLGSTGLQGRSETMVCRSEKKMDSLLRERPLEIHREPDPRARCPSVWVAHKSLRWQPADLSIS